MRAALSRIKRLENVRAAERRPPVELQLGYVKELPREYTGERHIVTVGRDSDGHYQWEERPGPAPAREDDDNTKTIIMVELVSPPSCGGAE